MKPEKNYNHPDIKNLDDRLLVANATADIFVNIEKAKTLCLDIWRCNFTQSSDYIKKSSLESLSLINDYHNIQTKLLILGAILDDMYDELACFQGLEECEDNELYSIRQRKLTRYTLIDTDKLSKARNTAELLDLYYKREEN